MNEDFWIRFVLSILFTLLEAIMYFGIYHLILYIGIEYKIVDFLIFMYVNNSIHSNMESIRKNQRIKELGRELGK